MNTYDVAIVGGGAAGLSAALVLARADRAVVVVDAGEPRNAPAAHMQGFLSRDGMPPAELLAVGRAEVEGYGGHVVGGTVASIGGNVADGFEVALVDGDRLSVRRVLVTTGLTDELPAIDGLWSRWGNDVLHCPYCHGYEVRDRRIAVLGGTPDSVQHALLVRQWASDVVYFPHTDALSGDEVEQLTARSIGIVEGLVSGLAVESGRIVGIEMAGGGTVARDVVFVRPMLRPNSGLLERLGCETDLRGWVVVDAVGATSIPGVWGAGNATNPRAQVITAAGEGSAAAIAINNDLVADDVALAVRRHRGG